MVIFISFWVTRIIIVSSDNNVTFGNSSRTFTQLSFESICPQKVCFPPIPVASVFMAVCDQNRHYWPHLDINGATSGENAVLDAKSHPVSARKFQYFWPRSWVDQGRKRFAKLEQDVMRNDQQFAFIQIIRTVVTICLNGRRTRSPGPNRSGDQAILIA